VLGHALRLTQGSDPLYEQLEEAFGIELDPDMGVRCPVDAVPAIDHGAAAAEN
jgi:hypothetical protein